MVFTLFYFFLALILLVTVHEYGHFIVARCCGVKVLRFSFGFGKTLARWRSKNGIDYVWSLVPLGGYVKMLDESEGPVAAAERHLAFNTQPVWKRLLIVIAGPLFNFIFAFFMLWLVLVWGVTSLAPIIATVKPNSVAAKDGLLAGEEIVALNHKEIGSWHDFQFVIMPLLGRYDQVSLQVKSLATQKKRVLLLSLPKDLEESTNKQEDFLTRVGIVPFIPKIPPIVGEVLKDSPAQSSGLQPHDQIKTMNDKPLNNWLDFVDYVRAHPNKTFFITLQRDGLDRKMAIKTGSTEEEGREIGFLGVNAQKVTDSLVWFRKQKQDPLQAIRPAFNQTVDLIGATFALVGRFVTGKLSLQHLSGPVGIAQGAAQSARSGAIYYLTFLALVSISLGVLNLLPIPLLDGGHLLYFLIEGLCRRHLSNGIKLIGTYIGLLFLFGLMVLALNNDLARLG